MVLCEESWGCWQQVVGSSGVRMMSARVQGSGWSQWVCVEAEQEAQGPLSGPASPCQPITGRAAEGTCKPLQRVSVASGSQVSLATEP